MAKNDPRSMASIYASMIPRIREVAFRHGYAITVHGSMARDLDLVAIPWVEDAEPVKDLIAAIKKEIGGHAHCQRYRTKCPEKKPHGRLAWSFYFSRLDAKHGTGPYIDISVMPLVEQEAKA